MLRRLLGRGIKDFRIAVLLFSYLVNKASGWNSRYHRVILGESHCPVTHRIRIVKLILPGTRAAFRRDGILTEVGGNYANTALA